MNKNTSQGQILIPFANFSCLLPDDCAGAIARDVCRASQACSSVDIVISPLIYHLGGEQ
jgi:hypothetical protein